MQSSSGRSQSGQGLHLKYERIVNDLEKHVDDLWIERVRNLGSVENEWGKTKPKTKEASSSSILPMRTNRVTVAQMSSQNLHKVTALDFYSA